MPLYLNWIISWNYKHFNNRPSNDEFLSRQKLLLGDIFSAASLFYGFSTFKIKAIKVRTEGATYPSVQGEKQVGWITICRGGNNGHLDSIMTSLFTYFSLKCLIVREQLKNNITGRSRGLSWQCPSSQVSFFTHFDGFFSSVVSGRHRPLFQSGQRPLSGRSI